MTLARTESSTSDRHHAELPLLRALLLCSVAEQADQAMDHRAQAEELSQRGRPAEARGALLAAEHLERGVRAARHALRRLADGSYGTCEACGAPMAVALLRVMPHAQLCAGCAEAALGSGDHGLAETAR